MDISGTYVKMCEKAEEIQGLVRNNPVQWLDGKDFIVGEIGTIKQTWLPRQDQLQEMVDFSKYQIVIFKPHDAKLAFDVQKKVEDGGVGFGNTAYWLHGNSMEQLWILLVMKEKYGKLWDGHQWLKSEELK